MPTLIELITDLGSVTLQMEKASTDNDWTLAENLQNSRATMIARIIETAKTSGFSVEETHRLKAIRQQEAEIITKAINHRDSIGQALAQLRTKKNSPSRKKKLLDKTYGAPGRRQ